ALPSFAAIGSTYVALRLCLRSAIDDETLAKRIEVPLLSARGCVAAAGIAATAVALLSCSAFHLQLGLPTFLCGVAASLVILLAGRESPLPLLKEISWGILPLVA